MAGHHARDGSQLRLFGRVCGLRQQLHHLGQRRSLLGRQLWGLSSLFAMSRRMASRRVVSSSSAIVVSCMVYGRGHNILSSRPEAVSPSGITAARHCADCLSCIGDGFSGKKKEKAIEGFVMFDVLHTPTARGVGTQGSGRAQRRQGRGRGRGRGAGPAAWRCRGTEFHCSRCWSQPRLRLSSTPPGTRTPSSSLQAFQSERAARSGGFPA